MPYVSSSRLLLILSTMLLFAGSARADALSTHVEVRSESLQCSQFGTTAASCSAGGTVPLGSSASYFFTGKGQATASFGSLGTFASGLVTCSNCVSAGGVSAALAGFEDMITMSNAPTSGVLDFTIHTSGSGFLTCVGPDLFICGGSTAQSGLFVPSSEVIDGILTSETFLPNGVSFHDLKIAFTSSGGVASLDFALGLTSNIVCQSDNTTNCNAETNFIDTAQVTGVRVLDANGNVVSNASLTSQSGTNYNAIAAPTPEPGTLSLFAIGLLALVVLHRRLALNGTFPYVRG